jgi:AAA domain
VKLQDFQQTAGKKILVYGAPKTGKTELVAKLSAKKKLWWLDLEDGIKTVFNNPRIPKQWIDNIEYFHLPDTQIFPIAARTLLKLVKGGEKNVCHAHGAVDCPICKRDGAGFSAINLSTFTNDDVLVIDSVSQLAASAMNDIQSKVIQADQFDKKPDWDDYFNQGRIMDRIFSIMQQAPFNVVAISHEQMVEQEDKSKKIVPIGGTSQFSKTFAKYFDEVCYCEIVNKKHVVATSSTYKAGVMTGSRTDKTLEKSTSDNPLLELFV